MIRRLAITILLAVLGTGLAATSAQGMVIYNESESGLPNPVGIEFHCGVFCYNYWQIPAHSSATRPGKGGSFRFYSGDFSFIGRSWKCDATYEPALSDHGWAELHFERTTGDYFWHIFGNDSQAVSGSPFLVRFGKYGGPHGASCLPVKTGATGDSDGSQAQQ
jgi:hypothetical protein